MSLDKLRELVAAAAKATPGPWTDDENSGWVLGAHGDPVARMGVGSMLKGGPCESAENRAFITAARNSMSELSLLMEREAAAQARIKQLEARVRDAEAVMLLHRGGKHGEAQVAYMDYCGKYLGEPSRG